MDINAFLPPMAGSFSGVIIAFILNYAYRSYLDNKKRDYYIDVIKDEIERCGSLLGTRARYPLPTDIWTSAVNSGGLRFFKVEEAGKLSAWYSKVQDLNEDVKRARDLGVEYLKSSPKSDQHANLHDTMEVLYDFVEANGLNMKSQLENLMKEDWMLKNIKPKKNSPIVTVSILPKRKQ